MARATTHPITDQPRNKLITNTEPTFVTYREKATIVGRKYKAIIMIKPIAPIPLAAAAAPTIISTPMTRYEGD